MEEAAIRAYIEERIAALEKQKAQGMAQVNAAIGGIMELQQLLSGFDQPTQAPAELPAREAA